jgi:hypothetical protein
MADRKPMNFVFQSQVRWDGAAEVFVAQLPRGLSTKEQLLDALDRELRFPDYFRRNWDALDECMGDLAWIPQKKVVLLHQDVPDLEPRALKAYLEILNDAVAKWNQGEEHELIVVFPEETVEVIGEVFLGTCENQMPVVSEGPCQDGMTRKNLLPIARRQFPEVEECFGEAEGSYLWFGDLGRYIVRNVETRKLDEEFLSRVFELLNEMATHKDPEVQNILVVGFLEAIVGQDQVMPLLRKYFCAEALRLLDRTISEDWGEEKR